MQPLGHITRSYLVNATTNVSAGFEINLVGSLYGNLKVDEHKGRTNNAIYMLLRAWFWMKLNETTMGTVSISRIVMCIHVAVQICNIFLMEWVYKCMYMCHIELRCSIHILHYNVSQPAPPCRIMSWHAISTHLIARHFLSLPWLSCWCVTQIVQICNFNHPDT